MVLLVVLLLLDAATALVVLGVFTAVVLVAIVIVSRVKVRLRVITIYPVFMLLPQVGTTFMEN